jgi:hypothetical protein
MRKRLLAVLLIAALCLPGVFAKEKEKGKKWEPGKEPLMAPGDLAITAGVGYGFLWGAIDVSGGVEYMIGKFEIADTIPLTWGVAAKAAYYRYSYDSSWYYSYLGAGAFGTLHLSIKDLDLPENMGWAENVDTYIGLGAGFYSWNDNYYGSTDNAFRINIRTVGGVNYFLNDHIAINLEGGYYGGWGGGLIGILFKL